MNHDTTNQHHPNLAWVARACTPADVPIDLLRENPRNPRTQEDPEALAELTQSVSLHGVLVPVLGYLENPDTPGGPAVFQVLAGNRRVRAARAAGLTHVPALALTAVPKPWEADLLAGVENEQRADLSAIDKGRYYQSLSRQLGCTDTELARLTGKNSAYISRHVALVERLPDEVQDLVQAGRLPDSTAYEISKLADPDQKLALAHRVIDQGLTRSEVEQAVQAAKGKARTVRRPGPAKPPPVVYKAAQCTVTVTLGRADVSLEELCKAVEDLARETRKAAGTLQTPADLRVLFQEKDRARRQHAKAKAADDRVKRRLEPARAGPTEG
jgi:ParB family chromosome partitioning protein